ALQRLKNTHKSFLITKFECVSECIAKPGEQPLLNEVFTSLHITEGECGELNYNHEVRQIESKKARSQALTIKCNDIFIPSKRSPKRIRTVLTKGIAGIGKTFSVQKFILDWAAGDDNCGFDFIYIFPFRELNLMIKEKNSLVELVQLFYPHMKECEDVSSLYSTKVLYIFDGLDESRLHLDFTNCGKLCDVKKSTVLDVLLINLIKGDLLPSASLWITSRPAAASHIPYQYISRLTEIQGFEDQQKDEYFRKKFKDSTLAEKIILHVRMLRSVHVMCYVPAFCWIIATVLGHTLGENGNENIPRTLTEVYTHFLLVLLALQNQKHENIEELLKENQEAILNMGKLAFRNLKRNNLIFYEDDLRECGIDIRQSCVYSGVCREIFKENSAIFKETVYSFVHLTVQEYFAALYVFASFQNKNRNPLEKTVNEKFRGIFRTRLCEVYKIALNKATKSRNGHLDLFLRFLLGLGMKTNQELLKGLLLKPQDKSKDIQKTTEDIKQMIRKTTSPERSINLFHCLSELNDNSLVEEIKMSLTLGNLSQNLSPSDYSALAYVLQMSEDELDALDEDQQKDEYFRKKFKDPTLAEKILLHVRMLRSVHVMCYVPAFCWIIATVLGHTLGENGNENVPRTLTEVYTHFLLVLLALQNQKHENIKLLKENQEDILNLGKLAFLNLERNNLIFYEDDLRECGIDIRQSCVYSGVCREIFKENSAIFKETVYSFVHLTVQEYFAALYVFASFQNKNHNPLKQTVIEKFRGIFRTRLCDVYNIALNKATKSRNGHLDLFLRFLLGLGMKTNQELLKGLLLKPQDKSKDIQKTTKDIKQMIRKNTSPESSINLFHCLSELNDNSLVKNIEVSLTSGNLLQQNLSPSDYSALAYVLQMSEDELDALDLSSHSLRDEGLLRLMPAARLYKRLMLRKCDLTGDCCEDLASALCANQSTLRELQLEGNNLGDSGVKLLFAALKDPNCKLEKLGLFECDLTGVCCEDLASALRTNHSTLRELELGWNNLGSSGGKLLSAALKDPNCKLKKLGLRGCRLTADCFEDLASALRTNQSTLRELKLGWNNLGDSGMKLLSAALEDPNCKLEKLELTRCRLTGDCCEDLASALRTNHSTLRELELGWNNLGLSGAKLLSAALKDPNCKLEKLG
ncbi:UNVERIFIED_CONTAM: hypothetical protein FKN15_055330, partial [Acipenser sinensis]